jgi:lipase
VTLHTHAWGGESPPPLFCLHGITAWGGRFRRIATLRLTAFRVHAPDLRGHGLSPWEPPWDLDRHVADLVGTLDELGHARVSVVGHSFGGRLALELAARHPERVAALVLLDPAVWVPPRIALERAEERCSDESYATVEAAVARRLADNPRASREILEEELREQLRLGDDGRYRARWSRAAVIAAYGEMSKHPPLDAVRARSLVVRGLESDVTPEAVAEACRDSIGSKIVTVPGGHNVMWDAFDATADAIVDFLSEDPRAER